MLSRLDGCHLRLVALAEIFQITVDDYYRRGLIRDAADLYELKLSPNLSLVGKGEDTIGCVSRDKVTAPLPTRERQGEGLEAKIIASIEESRQVPFERVLYAIGIRFVGEIAAKTLARYYGSMDKVAEASMESLTQVSGIGEVIAGSVIRFFANPVNRAFVERLRSYGLQMEIGEQQKKAQSDKLEGQSIVISGVFQHHSRDEYKALIEQNGGKNVGSISSKTSFILAGENMGPSKLEKAQKLGIRILNEEEFLAMIN